MKLLLPIQNFIYTVFFFTPAALLQLKFVVSLTCTFCALWDSGTSLLIVLKITLFLRQNNNRIMTTVCQQYFTFLKKVLILFNNKRSCFYDLPFSTQHKYESKKKRGHAINWM
jgi:hypothetical protein